MILHLLGGLWRERGPSKSLRRDSIEIFQFLETTKTIMDSGWG
jgi:hypothetical protein